MDLIGNIEDPHDNQIFDINNIVCRGWVYDDVKTVIEIQLYLNNEHIGNARMGYLFRTDLISAFPKFDGIQNSGFIFYGNNAALEKGKNVLQIKVLFLDGSVEDLGKKVIEYDDTIAVIDRLNVELTNRCNLNCRWCGGSGKRKKGFMSDYTFEFLLRWLNEENVRINELHLYHGVGESLLHPKFQELLHQLGRVDNRPKTVLVTNAVLLNEECSKKIISSRCLDFVQFSVDGGNRRDFEWLRRGAHWDSVLDNVSGFLKLNNNVVKTGIICIDFGGRHEERFDDLLKRVDSIDIRPPHDWTGQEQLEDYNFVRKPNPHPCWHIRNNLAVLWNGDVTLCCNDQYGNGVFGNVLEDNLLDLWKTKHKEFYDLQISGEKHLIPLCKNCSIN